MRLYDIPAPAKLNLFLHVVGRRSDGYHLLQTVFRFVDLCDVLHVETRTDGRITREGGLPGVAQDDDLVVRAARALQQATGMCDGAHIALEKRIPAGGGLGGGSSDAASTLIALNRLWGTGLSRSDLMRLALPLGADVPVFIFGRSAFAQGVGEMLSPVDLPDRAYLIARPDVHVPTPDVFRFAKLTRDTKPCKITDFLHAKTFGKNDLETAARVMFAEVDAAARSLQDLGLAARMTGSGACFFVEFQALSEAILAEKKITATVRVADIDANWRKSNWRKPQPAGAVKDGAKDGIIVWTHACKGLFEHPLRHWIAD